MKFSMSSHPLQSSRALLVKPCRLIKTTIGCCKAPWRTVKQPLTTCRYNFDDDDLRQARRQSQRRRGAGPRYTVNITEKSLAEYALPAAGLLVASLIAGPVLGGLVFAAMGLGTAVMAATALSWAFVPLLALGGVGLVLGGAVFAGAFATAAGGYLIFNLLKLGALGAALWLGAKFAQSIFEFGQPQAGDSPRGGGASRRARSERSMDPNATIDVEAETLDDWRDDVLREQRRKEEELREFDDLLRRREAFKKGGGSTGR